MKLYTLKNTHFSPVIYKTVFFFFSKREIKKNLKKEFLSSTSFLNVDLSPGTRGR